MYIETVYTKRGLAINLMSVWNETVPGRLLEQMIAWSIRDLTAIDYQRP